MSKRILSFTLWGGLAALALASILTPGCAPDLSQGTNGLQFCRSTDECNQKLGPGHICKMRLCQKLTDECVGEGQPCEVPGLSGICKQGRTACQSGTLACLQINQPKAEDCKTPVDDNCDGQINEAPCACDAGKEQPCYPGQPGTAGKGICKQGVQTCKSDNTWGDCRDFVVSTNETCNGKDDNCDGNVDETYPEKDEQCLIVGKEGPCQIGQRACEAGKLICKATTQPTKEVCDGKDNDCNGQIDEIKECECKLGQTQGCYTGPAGTEGKGPCKKGSQKCVPGPNNDFRWGPCEGVVLPKTEECNGADDDCDGSIDETFPEKGSSCIDSTKQGACQKGTYTACTGGKLVCTGSQPAARENCNNNIDDDCNGKIDEKPPCDCKPAGATRECGSSLGECKKGSQTCGSDGQWGACSGDIGPKTEECNGKDDDCDGQSDEGIVPKPCYTGPANTKGKGICRDGKQSCTNGKWTGCQNEVLPGTEDCNGKDDDCNGKIDDNLTRPPCPLTQGVCSAARKNCGPTGWFNCTASNYGADYEATETKCDGKDNDCNGQVDENGCGNCSNGQTRPCMPAGYGGCATISSPTATCTTPCAAGTQTCQNGKWGSCTGATLPKVETCNGVDDDCNGAVDDNLTPPLCQDQLGACAGSTKTCKGASGWANCTGVDYTRFNSNAKLGSETACDSIDNNCNGQIDENCPDCSPNATRSCYSGPPGTAEVGQCTAGIQTCLPASKTWGPCVGEVLPGVEVCDASNTDEDCDGNANNIKGSSGPLLRACYTGSSGCVKLADGVYTCAGSCKAGTQTCTPTGWSTSCSGEQQPQAPAPGSGKDQDCDGRADGT